MTLAEAQASLVAIDRALARGERTVQFSDRMTTYRSTDELLKARAFFAGIVGQLSGRSKQTLGYAEKGF